MPFDPLSVIGYVGTAAGLLGFLVSTVTRLEQFGRDFRGCRDKLRWCNTQIRTCMLHLEVWKEAWCEQGRPYPDADYVYFLGADNFEEMKTKISLVHLEINQIGLLLYSKDLERAEQRDVSLITNNHWERWQTRLDRLQGVQRVFQPDSTWLQKICFASFRGMNLEERMKRLKDEIADLKDFSRMACWRAQFRSEVNKDITQADLMRILDRKARFNDLTDHLQALYRQCVMWGTWSVVLSPPDEEGGPMSLEHTHDVLIEFDVSRKAVQPKDIGIVPFRWSQVRDMPVAEYISLLDTATGLVIPSSRSRFLRSTLTGLNTRVRRSAVARTALGLVNWTILLWHTPWTDSVCTCRIRFVDLDIAGGRQAATLTPFSVDNSRAAIQCDCHTLFERKALLLGVSLAELALGDSIGVVLSSRGPLFQVNAHQLSMQQLLRRIDQRSPGFMPAVRFCLYYDAKLQSGECTFSAEHVILFKEQVLDL